MHCYISMQGDPGQRGDRGVKGEKGRIVSTRLFECNDHNGWLLAKENGLVCLYWGIFSAQLCKTVQPTYLLMITEWQN